MPFEFVALCINPVGASLIFTEADGAGPGVPFPVSSIDEASRFLASRTNRIEGVSHSDEELAIAKGAISLGLLEPSDELMQVLKLRRAIRPRQISCDIY